MITDVLSAIEELPAVFWALLTALTVMRLFILALTRGGE